MSFYRWLFFTLSIAIGVGLGLYYGWVVSPIEYVDTNLDTLRADFRADYTLMVAETYTRDPDIKKATYWLGDLKDQPPSLTTLEALNFARENNFYPPDIDLLENLSLALRTTQPVETQPPSLPGTIQP